MSNKSQKKAGVFLAYISEGIRILTGLIYTPIMLHILGDTEYGLYQLVASTVSYLSLLNLGFTGAYTRYYTKAKKDGDSKVSKLNGMFMSIFVVMSIVCVGCGIVLISNAEAFFGNKLNSENYGEVKVLIGILIASMALSFPTSVFTCNISANERFTFEKGITALQNILNPFLCLPLLLLGYGNIGVVSVSCFLTFLRFVICYYYCIKKLGMKFQFNNFDYSLLKSMGSFTFFIFINQIIDQVNWNLDKYLLGRFASLSAIAIYGIGSQLNSLYISSSNSIASVFAPQINRLVIFDDDGELSDIFTRVGRVQYIIVFLILSGFAFFGKEFIYLWAGEAYEDAYYVALALMIPMLVPLIQNIGIEIQRAKNKHQVRSIVYLLMAVLNACISIPLILHLGSIGAALGTTVSLVLGNIIFMNIYYHKCLNINIISFWKSTLRFMPASIIVCIIAFLISRIPVGLSWLMLAIKISFYLGMYFIVFWLIGFNDYERSLVSKAATKIIHRKHR